MAKNKTIHVKGSYTTVFQTEKRLQKSWRENSNGQTKNA